MPFSLGSDADDHFIGTDEHDNLKGFGGDDHLEGGAGDDILLGYQGSDTLIGGADDDYLSVYVGGRDQLDGGDGNDHFTLRFDYSGSQGWVIQPNSVVRLAGGGGDDLVVMQLPAPSDAEIEIDLGEGADLLALNGHRAARVTLGAGEDVVQLVPEGADFVTSAVSQPMVITDFQPGQGGDRFDWAEFLNAALTNYSAGSNPFGTGHARLFQSGSDTLVQIDLDGAGSGQRRSYFRLEGVAPSELTAANFGGYSPTGAAAEIMPASGTGDIKAGDDPAITIVGTSDDDVLEGGPGDDALHGGDGEDFLDDFDDGDDQLFGEGGNDHILVNQWSDDVGDLLADGGAGDDEIRVLLSTGNDEADIVGGDGHDLIHVEGSDGAAVTIDAGAGNDYVTAFRSPSFSPAYTITLGAGADFLRGVVGGGRGATTFANFAGGDRGPVTLTDFDAGDGGDVILLGLDLIDELPGWNPATNPFALGFMRLVADGADTLLQIDRDGSGFADFDFVTYAILQGVAPADLAARNLGGYAANGSTAPGQSIAGTSAADSLSGTMSADAMSGGDADDRLFGAAGNDLIEGGEGADHLDGEFGDDVLHGNVGDDHLDGGGDGDDQLFGGDGDDRLVVSRPLGGAGDTILMEGGAGNDELTFIATTGNHQLVMRGGDDADSFDVRAIDATVEIEGGAGDDQVAIDPDDGNGYDILLGSGSDSLTLHSADPATFSEPDAFNVVVGDFETGAGGDSIVLTDMLTHYAEGWDGSIDPFAAGYVRLVQTGADTLLQIDPDGGAPARQYIDLVRFEDVDRQAFAPDNFDGLPPNLGNQAPVLAMSALPAEYLESLNEPSSVSFVDTAMSLTDADGIHLVSISFAITGGFRSGEDRLLFSDNVPPSYDDNGIPLGAQGDIVGEYDQATGVLVLTSTSGMATLEQWRSAAGAVGYSNLSEEPDATTRTVTVTADDGQASDAAARDILIVPRNDAPAGTDLALTIAEDSEFTFAAAHFGFSDVDGDAFAGVKFSAAPTGGKIYYDADGAGGGAPVEVIVDPFAPVTYSAADIAAGKLTFVPTADLEGSASVSFRVVDNGGTANDGWDTDQTVNLLTFDVTPANDAPSLAVAGGTVVEHSPVGTVVATASADDPDGDEGSLVFSLDDDADGRFAIDAATGAIKVADQARVDHESGASHQITVRVTDAEDAATTLVKTVTVTNAAETRTGGAGPDDLAALSDEDWMLLGAGGDDSLVGRSGDDRLDGGSGADDMAGAGGDDRYLVDHALDQVVELGGGGTDTVESGIDYTLSAEVERLVLAGGALNGTGNALANILTGNSAANVLNGMSGADEMRGGAGSDLYVVDMGGDEVVELSGQGIDTVRSSASYTLADHVEHLLLSGGGDIRGSGNGLANTITGNNGNNRLDGKAAADTLAGGKGHDVYVVNNAADQVIEEGSSGNDTVESAVTYRLPGHVEKLILTGGFGYDGIGNSSANRLTGNAGANFLNGGRGNDLIDGGAGNDQLMGNLGHDRLTGGAGDDRFYFNVAPGSANADDILDLSAADDSLWLLRSVFTAAGANGTLAASAFHLGSSAADAGDRILYDAATGDLFYDADGTGAAAPLLFASVDPGTALSHVDFVIYG